MLSGVIIADEKAEVLIKLFIDHNISQGDLRPILDLTRIQKTIPPLLSTLGKTFILKAINDIIIIGITANNDSIVTETALIEEIASMLNIALKQGLCSAALKEEYPYAYEIIDMFVGSSLPLISDFDTICAMKNGSKLTGGMLLPWNSSDLSKSKQQELKVDVKEDVFARINEKGKTDTFFVHGSVNFKAELTDISRVSVEYSSVEKLGDFSYNKCVDASQYSFNKLDFIPPGYVFTLMNYTSTMKMSSLPIYIVPDFKWSKINVLFHITAHIGEEYINGMQNFQVKFKLPNGISCPSLLCNSGSVSYNSSSRSVVWDIDCTSKNSFVLDGSASLAENFNKDNCNIPIYAGFAINGITLSGFKIKDVTLFSTNKCNKSISYSTASSQYIFNVN